LDLQKDRSYITLAFIQKNLVSEQYINQEVVYLEALMKLKNIPLYKITWIQPKNPSDQILKIKQKVISKNYSIKNKIVNKKVLQVNNQ
jgi:spore maturation protein CgeB